LQDFSEVRNVHGSAVMGESSKIAIQRRPDHKKFPCWRIRPW
jgi:hypothetical protein